MSTVSYVARRSLAPGHVLGESYELDLLLQDGGAIPGREHRSAQQESLSGAMESQLYMHKRKFTLTLAPVQTDELDRVLEFIDSVINKEAFTFAPYGPSGVTMGAILLEPTGFDLSMFLAQSGADDYFVPPRLVIREQ